VRIIDVQARDIYVTLEFSITQIKRILDVLDKVEIKYNKTDNPELDKSVEYFTEDFCKKLGNLYEDIREKK